MLIMRKAVEAAKAKFIKELSVRGVLEITNNDVFLERNFHLQITKFSQFPDRIKGKIESIFGKETRV